MFCKGKSKFSASLHITHYYYMMIFCSRNISYFLCCKYLCCL